MRQDLVALVFPTIALLTACGSKPSTRVQPAPVARADLGEGAVEQDSDPVCCDAENPSRPRAQEVDLENLLFAAGVLDASKTITALGRYSISVHCSSAKWKAINSQREQKTCKAGRVAMGDTLSELEVDLARTIGRGNPARATLRLLAEGPSSKWLESIRSILVAERNEDEVTAIQEGDTLTSPVLILGNIRVRIALESVEGPAQLILVRQSRSYLR